MRRVFGFLAALLLAAGCAGTEEATAPAGVETAAAATYERRVDPFPVLHAGGTPYALPFLGGLHVPRPQFVDLDADGDPDLFIPEMTGQVMFFENTGTPTAPNYTWRTDRFRDLDVGEWYRFADLDADGDPDLLAEEPYSYLRYFRNEGTPTEPRFAAVPDSLRDADGTPIFSDRQNIPNVTDIDCDDRPDLFLGRLDGTVSRYEAVDVPTPGEVPRFRLVTDRFEDIEIVAQFGASLHGANTLTFIDIDGDGDRDLFWGDFFEAGLLLIENTGSCSRPSLRGEPVPFPPDDPLQSSGYNAPTFADLDGDDDQDLLVGVLGGAFNPITTAADNLYLYERTDAGYRLQTRRFLDGIDVGSESYPAFLDLDGDGDQDLLLANKIEPTDQQTSRIYVFENTGTAAAPAFQRTDSLALAGAYHYAPAPADLDGDGDPDLLVGTYNDGVLYLRNDGTASEARFAVAADPLVELTRGSNTAPALGDLDADGDLDLLVGESSGTLNYYRNAGSASAPRFELVSDEYGGIDVGRRSVPVLLDLDGDGDLDLVVGREETDLVVFRNEGTPQAPRFVEQASHRLPAPPMPMAVPAFVDVDGDGDRDVFFGGLRGGLTYFENTGGQ